MEHILLKTSCAFEVKLDGTRAEPVVRMRCEAVSTTRKAEKPMSLYSQISVRLIRIRSWAAVQEQRLTFRASSVLIISNTRK